MSTLQTTSEKVGKDQVKLRVEVPESALEPALAGVYKRWAADIRVPGFRKGKVPRQLIDARVGPEAIREEALRDALPGLYRQALDSEGIEAIASPEIDVTQFEAGSPLVFEATVDVRPEVPLPDLSTIEIEAPDAEVTDAEIEEQLERLRDRFAELETVSRPAAIGDHVLVDLKGYRHEELVEGASAPDLLYEVGSQMGPPKLDEQLQGERAGSILKFNDVLPGSSDELSFTVLVKEVQAKKLPPLDEEFAKQVGEFESLDALREDLREKMAGYKVSLVEDQIRSLALQAFVDASTFEPPERLVEDEVHHRLHHVEEDLSRAGMTLAEYAERSGSTELEVRTGLREEATRSVKAEMLLEEIARTTNVDVTQEDLGMEIAYLAARTGQKPDELAEQLVSQQRLGAVAADVMRRKALEHVVDGITIKGRPEPVAPPVVQASEETSPEPEPETTPGVSSETPVAGGSEADGS